MSFLNQTLNWMQAQERDAKLDYLREILRCCTQDELRGLKGLINIAEKRSRSRPRLAQEIRRKAAPKPAHLAPAVVASVPDLAAPVSTAVAGPKNEGFWWEDYRQEDIIAFDVEFVTLLQKNSKGKHINAPATVAISNYDEKVYWTVSANIHFIN